MSDITDAERYTLTVWCVVLLCLSIPGNITILTALNCQAIKLDKTSLTLIEHLAVADLAYALFNTLPALISTITDGWILGDILCNLSYHVGFYVAYASGYLLTGFSVSKLLSLVFPLRARLRTRRTAKFVAASLWVCSLLHFVFDPNEAKYSDSTFRCLGFAEDDRFIQMVLCTVFKIALPLTIISAVTAHLLWVVKRAAGLKRQTLLTLIAISGVFIISVVPFMIFMILKQAGVVQFDNSTAPVLRFTVFIGFLNFSCNPIVYFLTITSFSEYVMAGFKKFTIKNAS